MWEKGEVAFQCGCIPENLRVNHSADSVAWSHYWDRTGLESDGEGLWFLAPHPQQDGRHPRATSAFSLSYIFRACPHDDKTF